MRVYLGVVFGLLLAHWNTHAADMCRQPFEAICTDAVRAHQAEYARLKSAIRDKALRAAREPVGHGGCGVVVRSDAVNTYHSMGHSAQAALERATLDEVHRPGDWNRLECFAKLVESEVFVQVHQRTGWRPTPTRLRDLFADVRDLLVQAIEDEALQTWGTRTKSEMKDEVSRAELVLADDLRRVALANRDPNSTSPLSIAEISNSDFGICGPDFLTRNAGAVSTGYSAKDLSFGVHTGLLAVVACPGLWLWAVSSPERPSDAFVHVLAHELGHYIDSAVNRKAMSHRDLEERPLTLDTTGIYSNLMRCLKSQYSHTVTRVESSQMRGATHEYLSRVLGRPPDEWDWRAPEITADYWASLVLSKWALGRDRSRSEEVVARSLSRLCFSGDAMQRSTKHSPSHLSGEWRISFGFKSGPLARASSCDDRGPDLFSGLTACGLGR